MRRKPSSAAFDTVNLDPRLGAGLRGQWFVGPPNGSTIIDMSGRGNHAPVTGTLYPTTSPFGDGGYGIQGGAASNYASPPSTETWELTTAGTTVSAWVWQSASNITNNFIAGQVTGSRSWFLRIGSSAATEYVRFDYNVGVHSTPVGSFKTLRWNHVAAVQDGGSNLDIYINGIFVEAFTKALYFPSGTSGFRIGGGSSAGSNARIYDLRYYTRPLSGAEVSLLASIPPPVQRRRRGVSIATPPAVTVRALASLGVG